MSMGLLFLMTQLIRSDLPQLEEEKRPPVLNFTYVPQDTPPKVIELEPPVVKERPAVAKIKYDAVNDLDPSAIPMDLPAATPAISDIKTPIGLPPGMPLIPISARYPDRAAQQGLCGQVIVRYDIGADGIPLNVAIVESSSRLFNKSAIQAISKARFKPDSSAGRPIAILNKHEKITYRLEEGC